MSPPENPSPAAPAKPSQPPLAAAAAMKDDDLSEEDLELKEELKLCVLQAQNSDPGVQKLAVEKLREEIRSATSSMTLVPKLLKFLHPHFRTLKSYFETMPESELKKYMADILSVLALTMSIEGERESLKYRLLGSEGDIGSWGPEYMRFLAGRIAQEFQKCQDDDLPIHALMGLVQQIVSFHMKHNAEPEAVDLLMEVGDLDSLVEHVDDTNYKRTSLYLASLSYVLPAPNNMVALDQAYEICIKFGDLASALRILQLEKGLTMEVDDEIAADDNLKVVLQEIENNTKLSEGYRTLARDIKVMEPKSPEDVYKVHLIDDRGARSSLDSARQNLAATSANASSNAGFSQDKLTAASSRSGSSENWFFRNKEHVEDSLVMHNRGRTPSLRRPSKRRRCRSTPPPYDSDTAMSSPSQRSSSSPPSPDRAAGHIMSSEDKASELCGHSRNSLGPVAIFWDIENCPVPKGAIAKDVYCSVKAALGKYPVLTGDIKKFSAYGNLKAFPSKLLEDLQSTGVQLFDVTIRKKDAADKAILNDMFLFALDNPAPATIMLISGDVDFATALLGLRKRQFATVLAISSVIHVSPELTSSVEFLWHWPSIAHGKFVEVPRSLVPGDLQILKEEIICVVEECNRHVLLSKLASEYHKLWHKTIILRNYGFDKLQDLVDELGDPIYTWGNCQSCQVMLLDEVDLIEDQACKSVPKSIYGIVNTSKNMDESTNVDMDTPTKDGGSADPDDRTEQRVPKSMYGTVNSSEVVDESINEDMDTATKHGGVDLDDGTEERVTIEDRVCIAPGACDSRNLPRRGRRP